MTKIAVTTWVDLLVSKTGADYVWGAKGPDTFDCSGLIYSTLRELGAPTDTPMGSWHQQDQMIEIPIDRAIETRGALLYSPKTDTSVAHIAVSLGNGKTIEARNPQMGVGSWSATGRGWTKAGLAPIVDYTVATPRLETATMPTMCNPAVGRVSSEYGWRPRISASIPAMLHAGIDIAPHRGQTRVPISAVYAGTVITAGPNLVPGRTGNHVVVRNPDGEYQLYGHLSRIDVKVGDKVPLGGRIGLMGATGNVTGEHLHFEVWDRNKKTRNPRIDFNAHGVVPGKDNMPTAKRAYYDRVIDGVRGAYQIAAEQQFLADRGEYTREVDGKDGYWTQLGWQKWLSPHWYKGTHDGKAGPVTIKALQAWLKHLGFYKGEIDGKDGPMTHTAVQSMLAAETRK